MFIFFPPLPNRIKLEGKSPLGQEKIGINFRLSCKVKCPLHRSAQFGLPTKGGTQRQKIQPLKMRVKLFCGSKLPLLFSNISKSSPLNTVFKEKIEKNASESYFERDFSVIIVPESTQVDHRP